MKRFKSGVYSVLLIIMKISEERCVFKINILLKYDVQTKWYTNLKIQLMNFHKVNTPYNQEVGSTNEEF